MHFSTNDSAQIDATMSMLDGHGMRSSLSLQGTRLSEILDDIKDDSKDLVRDLDDMNGELLNIEELTSSTPSCSTSNANSVFSNSGFLVQGSSASVASQQRGSLMVNPASVAGERDRDLSLDTSFDKFLLTATNDAPKVVMEAPADCGRSLSNSSTSSLSNILDQSPMACVSSSASKSSG